jgi:copper transport protein
MLSSANVFTLIKMKTKILAFALFLIVGIVVLLPNAVQAHASIVRSIPAANAALPAGQPPRLIQVWYTEDIELKFSRLEVLDQNGQRVDENNTGFIQNEKKSMQIGLKPGLPDGSYTVISFAASATDGHVVKSSFAFGVGVGTLPVTNTSPIDLALQGGRSEADLNFSIGGLANATLRWLNYLGSTALVGGLFFYLIIWRTSLQKLTKKGKIGTEIEQASTAVTARSQFLVSVSLVVLAVAWLGWLIGQTASYSGQEVWQLFGLGGGRGIGAFADFLLGSRYGQIWLIRLGLIGLASLVWFGFARGAKLPGFMGKITRPAAVMPKADLPVKNQTIVEPNDRMFWAVLGIGALILLTTSLNSHAASVADYAFLAIFNDWLHLFGTAFWIGGLFFVALTLPLALKPLLPGSGDKTRLLAALMPTFSQLAILSVALLGITGAISAFLQTGDLADIFATAYGVTLSVKLGLVLVLLGLGFYNQQVLIPRIRQFMRISSSNQTAGPGSVAAGKTAQQFRRTLLIEAALGIIVLFTVGVLTSLAPPNSITGALGGVIYQQKEATDLRITLAISPARLGDNTFEVALVDQNGQTVSDATDVRLIFSMREMEMGSPFLELKPIDQTKGRYLAQGSVLSMKGNWDVSVVVKRPAKADTGASFNFRVR